MCENLFIPSADRAVIKDGRTSLPQAQHKLQATRWEPQSPEEKEDVFL